MPPRQGALPKPDEGQQVGPSKTLQYRDFSTGLVRTGSRPGIPETALWDSTNAQVIGPGELHTLPDPGASIVTLSPAAASLWGVVLNISGTEAARLIAIQTDGSANAINPVNGALTSICAAGVLSSATRLTMWRDTHVLFIDPTKGYASWDGTNFVQYPGTITVTLTTGVTTGTWTAGIPAAALVPGMGVDSAGNLTAGTTILSVVGTTITFSANALATGSKVLNIGTGAPTSGRDIAVFEARAWIVTGTRGIAFTGPGSFTNFATVYSGGATVITDPVFQGQITHLLASIGLLWVVGADAFNTISNVQVDATSGQTTFQNDNLVAGAGSPYADSVQPLFRTIIFLTTAGVYAILGATPQKLSDALDGLFPDVAGLGTAPGGVFDLNNIRVYAVLVTIDGATRLLVYSRPTWCVSDQGALTWVTTLVRTNGALELWGTDAAGHVVQCFAGTTGSYDVAFKLFDYDALTRNKTVKRYLVEMEVLGSGMVDMDVYLESEHGSVLQPNVNQAGVVTWINQSGQPVTWVNNTAGVVTWAALGRVIIFGEAEFSGNLVSMRLKGSGSVPLIIGAFAWEIGATGEWVF